MKKVGKVYTLEETDLRIQSSALHLYKKPGNLELNPDPPASVEANKITVFTFTSQASAPKPTPRCFSSLVSLIQRF